MMENSISSANKIYSDEYIAKVANSVRESLKLDIPCSPQKAVELLNGEIIDSIEDVNIDAFIKKSGADSFVIHRNKNKNSELRDSFTIAHELGHLFLHMGYLLDEEKWNSISEYQDSAFYRMAGIDGKPGRYAQEEHEANEFAANFLMPKDEFIFIAKQHLENNKYNIKPIAEHFKVSVPAVANRGKWLGIFAW
ncbi:hypothetical protein R83H12_02015 [Fibrobacteria bacterium R8-3-H12]